MRQYTVKFTIGFGNDWQSLPDTVAADNPHKAIEYAKYYLETSEGFTKEKLDKFLFITLLLDVNLETWLKKVIDRIKILCHRFNHELMVAFKSESSVDYLTAEETRTILNEYVTFLKHMGYTLEFTVNFDTSCYDAFSIVDSKTGEPIFICDEL